MAEAKKKESGTKYYRCSEFSALSVKQEGERLARFQPYFEKWQGETVKVGYLASDNEKVQAILADDINVQEIEEADFKKATGPKSFKAPLPA